MRGVIGAAIETFDIFYTMHGGKGAFGQELVAASQACLLRLYSWKPTETIEAIVDSAVEVDRLRVSPILQAGLESAGLMIRISS